MLKKSSLALIVPCYNESESIPCFGNELVNFLEQFRSSLPDYKLSIIVVDNNSSDNSLRLLKELQAGLDCLTIESCPQAGYGAALKKGFTRASADYLSFLDLDNTYPLVNLIDLLNKLRTEDLDIVYGARIHKASEITFIRYLGNQVYVLLLKHLFNSKLTDVCSGMRVFKGSLKNEIINLKSDDLSFSIDFTSYALVNKWKISEYPIHYRNRVGESKLSVLKDGWLFLDIVIKNYINQKIR